MNFRDPGRVLIPLVTPFAQDESVDFDRLAALADWIVSTGRGDSLIVTGTTGEFPVMSDAERIEAWKVVKDAAGDRVPIIAGTGAASTRDSVRLTREAEKIGVDMAMVVGPYYQIPEQDGIEGHYREVAEATDLPIIVYNIPLFQGVNVDPETVRRLLDVPNIVAVKEEAGINPVQSTKLLLVAAEREDFKLYDGDDMMALPIIAQGAVGVVSGGSQICGAMMKDMVVALVEDRLEEAAALNLRMFPLFCAFGGNNRVNPIPGVRRGLELMGQPVGAPRRPLLPLDDDETKKLRQVMVDIGVISS
jgi:4-hydroxy-tetrahydrodipicolinate synthase